MPQTILIAGPSRERLAPFQTIAEKLGYIPLIQLSKDEILETLAQESPDLLILDAQLGQVLEMCQTLRGNPFYLTLPIVLLVENDQEAGWQVNDCLPVSASPQTIFSLLKKYL